MRLLPFALAAVVGTAALIVSWYPEEEWVGNLAAVLGAALLGVLALIVPWHRLPRGAQAALPLAMVALVFIARDAAGGPASGLSFLYLIPIVWSGLYGLPGEVIAVAGAAVAALVLPVIASYGAYGGNGEVARTITFLIAAALVAWALRRARSGEMTDPLTGLPNRRALVEGLGEELHRSARTGRPVSVVAIDLDRFKQLNDTRGHHAGDGHLVACADAWSTLLRGSDLLARVGGEEFVLVLPETERTGAAELARRLAALTPGGETFSAGIAVGDGHVSPEALHRAADRALYAAKDAGRDRLVMAEGATGDPVLPGEPLRSPPASARAVPANGEGPGSA